MIVPFEAQYPASAAPACYPPVPTSGPLCNAPMAL